MSCAVVDASIERMDLVVISGEYASDVSGLEAASVVISLMVVTSALTGFVVVTAAVVSFVLPTINVSCP